MKKTMLFPFAFVALMGFSISSAKAGSAVAIEPIHGKMVNSYGEPRAIAIQRAMAGARRRYGAGVKLLAYTDGVGYCAIGTAQKGSHVVIAVSLAKRSSAEARNNVLAQLAKAGGVTPRIISLWHDSYEPAAAN